MGGWESILATIVTVNVETTEAIHTLELFEAVKGNFTCTGDKL